MGQRRTDQVEGIEEKATRRERRDGRGAGRAAQLPQAATVAAGRMFLEARISLGSARSTW